MTSINSDPSEAHTTVRAQSKRHYAMRKKALDYLSRREHSRFELRNKLLQHDFDIAEIEILLDDLAKNNLQSDQRFAEMYLRSRKNAGFGQTRIESELRERGVSETIIADTLSAISEEEWQAQMIAVWRKKFPNGYAKNDAEKAAQCRFLIYRGFMSDAINRLLLSKKVEQCKLDNPDLPIHFIQDLLVAKDEDRSLLEPFIFEDK